MYEILSLIDELVSPLTKYHWYFFKYYIQITKHKEKIQDISTTASNEATLERMLQKV